MLALDVFGLFVAIATLSVFYKQQNFTVLFLLVIFGLAFIGGALVLVLAPPISYRRVHWYIDIRDTAGRIASVRKETTLVPRQRNIRSLVDRHMSVVGGRIEDFKSSLGEIHGPHVEGGSLTAVTLLKAPLPVGKLLSKSLSMVFKDAFPLDSESVSWTADHRYRELGLHVSLPEERPARQVAAYRFIDDRAEELKDMVQVQNGRLMELIVWRPKFGAKYVLEWEW